MHVRQHHNISAVTRLHGVPKTTLHDILLGCSSSGAKVGHTTTLNQEEEDEIAETCIIFTECGFGLGRREVECVVQEFLKVTNRKNPFKGGVPEEGWWSGFLKRRPQKANKKPQHLQMVRAQVSRQDIMDHWFNDCLGPTLKKLDLVGKVERIYNVDKSGVPLSWNSKVVLTKRGHKMPHALVPGSGREQVTVRTCVPTSSQILPPYVVYKGARVSPYHTFGGPLGTHY